MTTLLPDASACVPCWPVLLAAGGCSGGAARGAAAHGCRENVLNVYNWSDYIQPAVIADFEKEYGIHVNYDVFDSNEILETKLLTGHTNYDVVVPSGAFLERQLQADIYQKLDKSLLPNLKNVDPRRGPRRVPLYDPGNQYSVDYMWITSGVGYNAAEIRQRLPDAPRGQLAHAVRSRGGVEIPGLRRVDTRCALRGGRHGADVPGEEPQQQLAEDLKAAEKVLHAIRPYLRYVDSSRYIDNLANGDICLAMGWSGDVKQAHDRAKEAGKGVDIAYSIPQRGRDRQLRRARDPRRRAARAECAPVHQLPAAPGGRRAGTPISSSTPTASQPRLQPLDRAVTQRSGRLSAADVRARLTPERAAAAGTTSAC